MKKILLIVLFLGATKLFSQQQQDSILVKEIPTIKHNVFQQRQEIDILKMEVRKLSGKFKNQNWRIQQQKKSVVSLAEQNNQQKATIDSLSILIDANIKNITTNSSELGTEIQKVTSERKKQISALNDTIDENQLYWIIATLTTLLLGGLVYWLLGKRIQSSKTDVETQIKNTKTALEEESVKLDNKLVKVLETQLKLKQEETKSQSSISTEKADHSLALKVADEIVRMQKNISKMDEGTKGLKPLTKGIERIQNNFAANGYEMINLLNSEYDERNNIDVINFITDENLAEGKRIISAVIKPQVNYNGVLIQRAQVDVSQN